jgi:Domain of unknown function (DUF6471)
MGLVATERELADKTAGFIKAERKRAGVTYPELAGRLQAHGLKEPEASITNKLSWGNDRRYFSAGDIGRAGDRRSAAGGPIA